MTVNLSNGLVGLSLLTGSNSFASLGDLPAFESKAVRAAKAQFTMTPTTPPWKEEQPNTPFSAQVSAVRAMKSIIDKAGTGTSLLPVDVQTSFTTYKALDRLRVLAEAASAATASDAQRKQLQTAFAKGLTDLQGFLAGAATDKVTIAFGQPSRNVKTVSIPAPEQYSVEGKGLVTNRADPIPGLTGTEKYSITLSKPGATDVVTVDLSTGPQPPTIDSVSEQLNQAIAAIPLRNADGTLYIDENGETQPRWLARFVPDKGTDKWGFKLDAPSGIEQVTLDEIGAKDALVVATGSTALDAPTATQVFRLDDPAGDATRTAMTSIQALDRLATENATLLGKTTTVTTTSTDIDGKLVTKKEKISDVYANTDAAAVATDAQGNSYVIGTTKGDLAGNLSDGDDNLFLTKLDGEGKVVWQRSLGAAGSSTGAAISIGADGSIAVAGTVNGSFDGASTDGDMLVAKFNTAGEEQFSTVVRSTGSDTARAVAIGPDGAIFVGGRAATGGGDGFVARIDVDGKISERRTLDLGGSDSVTGLAVAGDGNLLVLTGSNGSASLRKLDAASLVTDLGSYDLGVADARAIAVAVDGSIAVGGATSSAINGAQVNSNGGERDGFVTRIDAGLSSASTTYLATSADDQVDSLTFMGGDLYAGGRTTGDLGATRRGAVDGFVARIDSTTGAIDNVNQFGQAQLRTEPVRIAANTGGANSLSALGFARGTLNPPASEKLTAGTALRAGETFSIKVDGGAVRKVTIEVDDTLTTLADRIRSIVGSKASVSTARVDEGRSLRIDMKAGHSLELIAGPDGSDALAKLGVSPQRISAPPPEADNAPRVKPGGSFGLSLTNVLNISTLDGAKLALRKVKDAASMSQTAYRSLYWDDLKAKLVDGEKNTAYGKHSTVREKAQLANYTAALNRLSAGVSSTVGF